MDGCPERFGGRNEDEKHNRFPNSSRGYMNERWVRREKDGCNANRPEGADTFKASGCAHSETDHCTASCNRVRRFPRRSPTLRAAGQRLAFFLRFSPSGFSRKSTDRCSPLCSALPTRAMFVADPGHLYPVKHESAFRS
jgi:hypothetical protein